MSPKNPKNHGIQPRYDGVVGLTQCGIDPHQKGFQIDASPVTFVANQNAGF